MASARPTSYSSLRNKLDTGDIVLFSGKGRISNGIKWLTSSHWSHVGMVVKLAEYDQIVLWESTTLSDLEDLDTGRATKGVQMVFLSNRLRSYEGEIAIRRLRGVTRDKALMAQLTRFRKQVRGKPYEKSKLELLRAAYDGWFGKNEEDLSSLFCSELVAEAYQSMGLLSEELPSNEYTPADFGADRSRGLELLRGELGPEVRIRP